MGMKVETHIEAPIEEVFARAADFAGAAETISGITEIEMLTDGSVGEGTRFRETRVMFGRKAVEEMKVVEFSPPERYVLGCENHGCRYRSEFRFTPRGSGTGVEMTFEATPLTFMAKVMSFVMRPMMKSMANHCLKDLEDLKTAIEGA